MRQSTWRRAALSPPIIPWAHLELRGHGARVRVGQCRGRAARGAAELDGRLVHRRLQGRGGSTGWAGAVAAVAAAPPAAADVGERRRLDLCLRLDGRLLRGDDLWRVEQSRRGRVGEADALRVEPLVAEVARDHEATREAPGWEGRRAGQEEETG